MLSGKPMSHWLDVLDGKGSAKAEQEEAVRILRATDQRSVLQSRILDRVEDRYSSLSLAWYQFYTSVAPRVRRHLPVPQFARLDLRTLSLLNGISTKVSPRQKSVMETVIRFGVYLQALDVAYGVALSEASQAPAEALSMARRELGSRDPVRRLGLCEAIGSKRSLEAWRVHGQLVNGLRADLNRLVAGDPVSEVSVAAHKALEHLDAELGTGPEPLLPQKPVTNLRKELSVPEPLER